MMLTKILRERNLMKRFQGLIGTGLAFLIALFVVMPQQGIIFADTSENPTSMQATGDYMKTVEEAIDKASEYMLEKGVNSEWEAIGLAQAGIKVPEEYGDILKSHIE